MEDLKSTFIHKMVDNNGYISKKTNMNDTLVFLPKCTEIQTARMLDLFEDEIWMIQNCLG